MISLLIYLQENSSTDSIKNYLCKEVVNNEEIVDILLLDEGQTKYIEGLTTKRYLPVPTGRGIDTIPLKSIAYMEKELRHMLFHMEDGGIYSCYGKFEDIAPFLDQSFWRCHKSYIVNLEKVSALYRYSFLLNSGESLPVSQKKYQSTKLYFNQYLRRPFLHKKEEF